MQNSTGHLLPIARIRPVRGLQPFTTPVPPGAKLTPLAFLGTGRHDIRDAAVALEPEPGPLEEFYVLLALAGLTLPRTR